MGDDGAEGGRPGPLHDGACCLLTCLCIAIHPTREHLLRTVRIAGSDKETCRLHFPCLVAYRQRIRVLPHNMPTGMLATLAMLAWHAGSRGGDSDAQGNYESARAEYS